MDRDESATFIRLISAHFPKHEMSADQLVEIARALRSVSVTAAREGLARVVRECRYPTPAPADIIRCARAAQDRIDEDRDRQQWAARAGAERREAHEAQRREIREFRSWWDKLSINEKRALIIRAMESAPKFLAEMLMRKPIDPGGGDVPKSWRAALRAVRDAKSGCGHP